MTEELDLKLKAYGKSDHYPFHMPGHKRIALEESSPYSIDITEIDGFDNLHSAEGILKDAQKRAANLYGSKQTYYLVNGSTCGLLAAISAAVKPGGKILMARNVHKAVYHAVYLRQLTTVYLNPKLTEFGIQGAIDPEEVKNCLKQDSEIAAVILTSPTYEGIVSDVKTIAEIVHGYGIPLIVDEAHGAHFGFHEVFPETAVRLGADVVIQSMHKVLPSLTQTALLHLNSSYIKKEKIERFLGIYQTSSPSYVLMAGMERCVRLLREEGEDLFFKYEKRLSDFYQRAEKLQHIHLMTREDIAPSEGYGFDPSKLVISVKGTSMTGTELYDTLLEKYHLQMEMVSGFYVLAMTSIMDSDAGFCRLMQALEEIDASEQMRVSVDHHGETNDSEQMRVSVGRHGEANAAQENGAFIRRFYQPREKKMELYQALELPVESVSFEDAIGRVSGSFVSLYPPGIPVLLPGELIEEEFIKNIRESLKLRLNLQGIADIINERINVVNF